MPLDLPHEPHLFLRKNQILFYLGLTRKTRSVKTFTLEPLKKTGSKLV